MGWRLWRLWRLAAALAAVEEDSLTAVASAVKEDSSGTDSINISYKQFTRSIIVPARATTNNHGTKTTKTRTKKTNRQYVPIQRSTLLDTSSAESASVKTFPFFRWV